jgi:L-alanine-DL-glutamate epimerase-like enolase superfamily enzyme
MKDINIDELVKSPNLGWLSKKLHTGGDGTVPVPDGPGLGVVYDWEYINKNRTAFEVFE